MTHRRPYDPAMSGPQVAISDRRATDINRGTRGHVVEALVDDPYEAGAKIATVRSVRDDPLADHLARGHIDEAQYLAGREFQRHFGTAERGPRAVQISEAVDGGLLADPLTDEQLMAGKWLARCYRVLGRDGSTLIHEMLISNLSTRQIAAARGMKGGAWEQYFARRLFECLNTLGLVFGFSNGTKP